MVRIGFLSAVGLVALVCAVSVAPARGLSQMTLSVNPPKPARGSTAILTVKGTADETALPAVVASSSATCPARIPSLNNASWSDDAIPSLGAFSRAINVEVAAKTQRFCAYLQPAVLSDNGDLDISSGEPLARAQLVLAKPAARPLRGEPNTGVSGGTKQGYGFSLDFDGSGRRIVTVRLVCGGSALHPPSLGKEFIGKRFGAKVSLPLTSRIRWSGLVKPDNSQNYDPPVPVAWTKPVRFSFDVKVIVKSGVPRAVVGTGALSSPGLPCPKSSRYVFPYS